MLKVYKYTLLDLARNRFAIGYAILLFATSLGLFMLEPDGTKALITLSQVVLALTPLLALVFTIIWHFNQYEFTVLLAVQPLRRSTIMRAQYLAVSTALSCSFALGVGLPIIAWGPGPVAWTLLITGMALTLVFCALGLWIAVMQRDRAKAVGIGLVTWVVLVLLYDTLLLWIMFSFSDRPIEPFIVPLAALNPIDLSRIIIMLKIDLAALLGYTGAIYERFFGSMGGAAVSTAALALWMVTPLLLASRAFIRKDL